MTHDADDSRFDRLTDAMHQLGLGVARIEGAVGALVARQEDHLGRVDDHEKRIRGIERRMYALPSMATLLAIGSLLVAVWSRIT